MTEDLILDISKKKAGSKPLVTWENILKHKVLSADKVAIATHKATRVVIVGGKGTGKTIIGEMDAAVRFETEKYFNAYGFRKYKEAASDKLGSYFERSVKILEMSGFKLKSQYKKSTNKHYQLSQSRSDMLKNPKFEYGSLDNPTGTDGGAPSNGGYYGITLVDEPVVKEDVGNPDKIPDKKQFDEDMDIIRDNLDRFNNEFMYIMKPKNRPKYREYFFMNDWGNHPLTIAMQKALPLEDFFEFNFGYRPDELLKNYELIDKLFKNQDFITRLMTNSILTYYDEEEDTLYVRMTKFANPLITSDEMKVKPLIAKIKKALISGKLGELAIIMGYRHDGTIKHDMLVYNIENFNHKTPEEAKAEGWKAKRMTYSWDIDTSRVLTGTPTIMYEKRELTVNDDFELDSKRHRAILIDKQIEIPTKRTVKDGVMNDIYIQQIAKRMTKHYKNMIDKPTRVTYAADDARGWYVNEIKKLKIPFIRKHRKFHQFGKNADIVTRQDMMQLGFDNGVLWNHPKNKKLEADMKVVVKQDVQSPKRKTTGNTNYLDRIDSAENGIIEYDHVIWRTKKEE